ncbi:MAG: MFS transporter [Gammaproteobacteria bacterium]|nr:MFS transporter [Gammaproteobacteria bacterium]NIR82537.1 MFS transporter [Gammaproteobacteria bacterium]NIR88363.1 MFS transporter [Gammaproteobacteria bacterium]NIU03675.1 MFS transporter [Gammaproteobacteria bacterium]NIV52889.1 MFS transporter [Gammaproteobacteria bacterium]
MKTVGAPGYAALGAGLIAISYGLARYAFGLFVPPIRAELGLSPDIVGTVGSLAFISFALASLVASPVADRLGARNAAIVAGAFALAGLTLISQAHGTAVLATGVFACGISTGLMMPALSAGVQAAVRPGLHGRVNAVMNAGTSLGLVVCLPAVLLLSDAWRSAYGAFALLAALGMLAAWLLPAASRVDGARAARPARLSRGQWQSLTGLSLFCFATGVVASAYWIFAPDLVVEVGGLSSGTTGSLWLAIGIAGLAGAWASDLSDRIGSAATQALALVATGVALALIAAAPGHPVVALVSAAVFGWAFMTLSGLYLVSGIRLLPQRPSLGPVMPFLAATVGQAVGAPLAGWAISRIGYTEAFTSFALLALLIAGCSPLYPGYLYGRWVRVARAGKVASP